MKLLENKKALVTGSSRGIGKRITELFLENGAEVWGLCTKPSANKADLEKCAVDNGAAFHEIYADVSDIAQLSQTVKDALKEAVSFDILVNNAGITKDTLSFHMKIEDWQKVLDINLTGTFVATQIISNDMIHKKRGSIINMSSIVGVHGGAGQVNYSASKAGLIGYTKSLAKEVGSRGVRVNAIAPGFIDTEMTKVVDEKIRANWINQIPLRRAGSVDDVAGAALFLASDLSTYVSGQVLGVDGGMGC